MLLEAAKSALHPSPPPTLSLSAALSYSLAFVSVISSHGDRLYLATITLYIITLSALAIGCSPRRFAGRVPVVAVCIRDPSRVSPLPFNVIVTDYKIAVTQAK